MIKESIARKYAKALIEIAEEDKKEELYGEELSSFYDYLTENDKIWSLLTSPIDVLAKKRAALEEILSAIKFSEVTANFLRILMDKDRIVIIGEIIDAYKKFFDDSKSLVRANIVSATELTKAEVKEITKALSGVVGKEVVCGITVDPSIIGGVIAYVGDLVFDGSVKTQLEHIRDNLKKG
jgi:F-type H+-transporting ATPase subunit delta